jgi:hypothetical protein
MGPPHTHPPPPSTPYCFAIDTILSLYSSALLQDLPGIDRREMFVVVNELGRIKGCCFFVLVDVFIMVFERMVCLCDAVFRSVV